MSSMMKTRQLMLGAATLTVCGTLIVGLASETPLILYPITPSLPKGFYVRTFGPPSTSTVAAFRAPEIAKRYKASIGEEVREEFLVMKPIITGPGDHVCNRREEGLIINGARVASTAARDRSDRKLPIWRDYRRLLEKEFFTHSTHTSNSFDGRHYGLPKAGDIRGVYHALSSLELISDG